MLERILTVAMSFAIVCVFGCEGPEALTEKKEKSSIINQKTQDVTEFDADGDAKVADMQVKSKNPYGAAMQGYGFAAGKISQLGIERNIQLFQAEKGRFPKDHEEFMTEIIKKYNIQLPVLPGNKKYQYDVQNHKLIIVDGA